MKLEFRGLDRWQREAALNAKRLQREIRRKLGDAGKVVESAQKAEFAGRLTDRRTKRRSDKGSRIGTFTGRAKRSIRARVYYVRRHRTFRCGIGPRGPAGWYMALHSQGWGKFPRRDIIEPSVRKSQSAVFALLNRSVRVIR